MAENQRGWGQQGQHERYDQSHDEHRGRDEDQHRYQGSENRYNTPGYGSGEYGGMSSNYGGSSSYGQQDRDRGQYGSGHWENDRMGNRGWSGSHQQSSYDRDRGSSYGSGSVGGSYGSSYGSNEYRGGSPYGSSGMSSGYSQGYGQGSGWGTTQGSGWGSSGYGSQGYGGSGYSGGYGSHQQYGTGSSGSWGGSSGAMGGSEYGSGHDQRRSSYGSGSGYSGGRSPQQSRWQDQQNQYGDRGFWEKTKDEVSSWFGDEEAERRREFDRRMSDMEESRRGMEDYGQGRYERSSASSTSHRGKGPKSYRRSDDRIREDISDRLADDHRVDASEIEIYVHDAEVTLTGTVDNREAKRRAEDIAEMVSGVQHVQNNIRVNREGASGSRTASQGISSTAGTSTTGSATSEMTGTTGASPTGTQGASNSGPGSSTGLTNAGKSSSGTTGKEK